MNLHPDVLATLISRGLTEPEIALLASRMLSAVTSLQAQLTALDAQISTLTAQRDAVQAELNQANITVGKLIAPDAPAPEPAPEGTASATIAAP